MTDIHGEAADRFAGVRDAFAANFQQHGDVGAALAMYVDGEKVVDLWGGVADQASGRPWEEDTLQLVFSTTKGATAAVAHLLAQRGSLNLDAPVCEYWPEFEAAGKEAIPVRWLLSHRAGLPVVDAELTDAEALAWDPMVKALAAQRPLWEPGTAHGYHALTYGWLVGEVVRRITGRSLMAGPLNPNGFPLSPAELTALHRALGPPSALPPVEPPGLSIGAAQYNAYRATGQFVSDDGHTMQFSANLTAGDPGTTAAMAATPHIRAVVADAASRSGATANGVVGEAPALYDVSSASNRDLARIIPIAIVAIGVLLGLVLRSLVAPLYLIVSVALSYGAALGVSVIAFIHIGGQAGLTFILPFLMFIFLLALGEDYNILVMTRIREEAADLPLRDAVVRAVGRTGTTVTSAGLVLAASFAALAIAGGRGSGGSQVRDIGAGLGIGILMDTFLVRTLLVPSTVALLGRWNWWPARMGRRRDMAIAEEPEIAATADRS